MKIELTDEAVIGDHIDKRIGGRMERIRIQLEIPLPLMEKVRAEAEKRYMSVNAYITSTLSNQVEQSGRVAAQKPQCES